MLNKLVTSTGIFVDSFVVFKNSLAKKVRIILRVKSSKNGCIMTDSFPEITRGQNVLYAAVKSFPQSPGIYKMFGKDGNILYVGKAKNLKNRVTSYTNVSDQNYRIRRMVSNVYGVTFTVTDTESDAIFLEADLIHTLKPPYNVLLKESSPFVSIGISKNHSFPRIWKHRGPKGDDEYLGPFSSVKSVDEALVNIQKIFQLRTCTDSAFGKRTRPCLQYDIKRCSAPCVGRISCEEYQQAVQNSKEFLAGKLVFVKDFLKNEMFAASNELNFEKAARCRDTIRRLEKLPNIEKADFGSLVDADIIAIYQQVRKEEERDLNLDNVSDKEHDLSSNNVSGKECDLSSNNVADKSECISEGDTVELAGDTSNNSMLEDEYLVVDYITPCIQVLLIRNGLYLGGDSFFLDKHANLSSPSENMASFFQQFYLNKKPPARILVNCMPADVDLLRDALRTKHTRTVSIECPQKGNCARWVSQALNNAIQHSQYETAQTMDFSDNLLRLAQIFKLPKKPERVEINDNSHNQGSYAYGCMVVANSEGFDKKSYRQFSVSAHKDDDFSQLGGSDFAMMEEMMTRRFRDPDILPDVMIIDGGAGQISAVLGVLAIYDLRIPIIGVAKGPDRNAGRERFFIPGRAPISLPEHDPTLHFIQRLRDEAHRFAIGTHRKSRSRGLVKSQLSEIPGVGNMRRKALIKQLGSVAAVKQASVEELLRVEGITRAIAESIYNYFH
ncbi:MAG: excinuclease ABC subunit UvrC [Holosporales bacterium]|nr:excinuclease ABC subunit UvrC [Holosporales bacterium]